MKIDFFLIIFILLVGHLSIYIPVSGYFETKKLKKRIEQGDDLAKNRFYLNTIIWLWVPVVFVVMLIPISDMSLTSIGIKWPEIDTAALNPWIVYPTLGLYSVFLVYNVYLILLLKYSNQGRAKTAKGVPDDFKWLFPITQREKKTWTLLSISAGIGEEIVYRGYLFYALAIIFPNLSLLHILLITTLIFGAAHIYLGKEAIRSAFLGLLLGVSYIVFDSVIPVIALHIAQDLVLTDMLEEG